MSSLLHPAQREAPVPTETPDRAATSNSAMTRSQRLRWFVWLPLAAILAFVVIDGALTFIVPSSFTQQYFEVVQTVGYLVAAVCFIWAALRVESRRLRWALASIGGAFFTNVLAELIYAYLVLVLGQTDPFPSIADAFYLLFYPLVALGVLLLPSRATGVAQRIKTLLDASIATTAVLAVSVYWLIGPTYLAGADTLLSLIVSVAYPVGDVLVIAALLALMIGGIPARYGLVYYWVTAGMICFVYADSLYTYLVLQGTYVNGTLATDPFWPAGSLMMSVAALYLIAERRRSRVRSGQTGVAGDASLDEAAVQSQPTTEAAETVGRVVFPSLSLLVLIALLLVTHPALPQNSLFPALEILAACLVVFVVTRQILTFRDLVDARIANARARQLDELKDQFITSINHELRTPLMTLQTYTEILRLRSDALSPERRGELVDHIAQSAESLVALVQSVLDTRQLERTGQYESHAVSVQQALEQSIALLDPREASAPRDLHVVLAPDLSIWGNPVYLQQILTNLLSNALKYSEPGTPIEVHGSLLHEANVRGREGAMVEITIRDYGLGIPAEQIPLLFHRFVRLPRELASTISGNGLGLYLCCTLAERMQGTLDVESAGVPGEGSTFSLRLPAPATVTAHSTHEATPIV